MLIFSYPDGPTKGEDLRVRVSSLVIPGFKKQRLETGSGKVAGEGAASRTAANHDIVVGVSGGWGCLHRQHGAYSSYDAPEAECNHLAR
ncbi:hypothetical protein HG530_011701 [Fusarium avenaceum]|nr:hypothetical protein HG530_011701 [Fusarium avenaceum]